MSLQDVCERLQAELIERGLLENVRVTIVRLALDYTAVLEYKNCHCNRDEIDGLG